MSRLGRTTLERLEDLSIPEPNSGCWLWIGSRYRNGYGSFQRAHHGGAATAHRLAYELMRGPIPDGLVLDHLCRVRCCINPAHVEPVTQRVNLERGEISLAGLEERRRQTLARTHCKRGHEWTAENMYLKRGYRECKRCHVESTRRRREASHV